MKCPHCGGYVRAGRVASCRSEWLAKHGPCRRCGSWKRLEVDHLDPKTKIHHSVWTWGVARRDKELEKCQVLCFLCHRLKTNLERGWKEHGEVKYQMGCRCSVCIKTHEKKLRKIEREKMSEPKTTHSTFRLRSYRMADGKTEEVFGDGPAPDGATMLLADDTIDQTTTRTHNISSPQAIPPSGQ